MADEELIPLLATNCRRIAAYYRSADEFGGDVIGQVYQQLSKAVATRPDYYCTIPHLEAVARRQAHREYRRLQRKRLL